MEPLFADTAAIDLAVSLLHQGRLVAFPTETVYGLGADASNPDAVRRIFQAKGRPADHPLIVHIAHQDQLYEWAASVPDTALQLAAQFWPGPLAMILPKQPQVSALVTGGQNTVGLRMPNHPVALQLLAAFGGGVAAPSANRFCKISPTLAAHVAEELGTAVDLILDGGACQVGVESTIIDLSGKLPVLLRPGHITREAIAEALNSQVLLSPSVGKDSIRAPGMMAVHYAPTTAAVLCPTDQLAALAAQLSSTGQTSALLSYSLAAEAYGYDVGIKLPAQPEDYAHKLYASLRTLDDWQVALIVVELPPQTETWRAVNDRLGKATKRASV